MLTLASDRVQAVWQNLLLIAYASTIAAIPMGDALLFSFTTRKPLAIGVARAVFVSSLGATLTMVIVFAIWLTLESVYPQLHIDHFFYQIIESRIRAKCFYRIIMIYVFLEVTLMCSAAMVGGFLASITPFVGEQNQNKTKFSFSSLMMDLPLGLGTISFVQTITWCLIRYLDRFRPVPAESIQDQQERMMMMFNNHNANTMKQSRRVTFKTSDQELRPARCSDVSRTSSTAPILDQTPEDDSQSSSRILCSSSSSTLLPNESTQKLQNSCRNTEAPEHGAAVQERYAQGFSPEPAKPQPILNSPAAVRTKMSRRPFGSGKSGTYTVPVANNSQLPKPSPAAVKGGSINRFTSGALGRYAWLRNQNSGRNENASFPEGPRSSAPYSRSGVGAGKNNKAFGPSPYQRVSFQRPHEPDADDQSSMNSNEFLSLENTSNGHGLEAQLRTSRLLNAKKANSSAELSHDEKTHYPHRTDYLATDSSDSDAVASENEADEWAEAKSEIAEEAPLSVPEKGRFFGW